MNKAPPGLPLHKKTLKEKFVDVTTFGAILFFATVFLVIEGGLIIGLSVYVSGIVNCVNPVLSDISVTSPLCFSPSRQEVSVFYNGSQFMVINDILPMASIDYCTHVNASSLYDPTVCANPSGCQSLNVTYSFLDFAYFMTPYGYAFHSLSLSQPSPCESFGLFQNISAVHLFPAAALPKTFCLNSSGVTFNQNVTINGTGFFFGYNGTFPNVTIGGIALIPFLPPLDKCDMTIDRSFVCSEMIVTLSYSSYQSMLFQPLTVQVQEPFTDQTCTAELSHPLLATGPPTLTIANYTLCLNGTESQNITAIGTGFVTSSTVVAAISLSTNKLVKPSVTYYGSFTQMTATFLLSDFSDTNTYSLTIANGQCVATAPLTLSRNC
jgi:hypothetical protein